jgi:phosphoglycolate phosphatase-like HAD superfamily hydrolase
MALHVVWDWNGTLLDDLEIVVDAVNVSLAAMGAPAIDADGYRDHYTRPVRLFYERLLGRGIAAGEWAHIDDVFHRTYRATLDAARLVADAPAALDAVAASGGTQSLLSMWWHDELVPAARRFAVDRYMTRIDGNRGEAGETKLRHLAAHLGVLRMRRVVVIGDSLDDGWAAREVGVPCVLYDGGSHHRHELAALEVPIASSLLEAVDLAAAAW